VQRCSQSQAPTDCWELDSPGITSEGGIGRELWNPFVFLAWGMFRSVKL
jgi:hypothetical protein